MIALKYFQTKVSYLQGAWDRREPRRKGRPLSQEQLQPGHRRRTFLAGQEPSEPSVRRVPGTETVLVEIRLKPKFSRSVIGPEPQLLLAG